MMVDIKKIRKLGKNFTVLYVEDDKQLQQEIVPIFCDIFKKVIVKDNGQEGLQAYKDNRIDVVITDVEMPVMSGLQMSKHIKKINSNCPIIVISAYTDVDYFLDAINCNINHYVLKPIVMEKIFEVLLLVCQHITDKIIAKKYKQQQLKQKIANEQQQMIKQISNCFPNPVLVYSKNNLIFFNQAFATLFINDGEESVIKTQGKLNTFLLDRFVVDGLIKKDILLKSAFDITNLPKDCQNIFVQTLKSKKIFFIISSFFKLQDNQKAIMYTFNDITKLIYQKNQIVSYNKQIESFVDNNYKTQTPKKHGIINRVDF